MRESATLVLDLEDLAGKVAVLGTPQRDVALAVRCIGEEEKISGSNIPQQMDKASLK